MVSEDTEKIVRFAKRASDNVSVEKGTWKILIVDDEPEVHRITKLVLKSKVIFGRALEFIDAASAQECKNILLSTHDIAVILLDVVMETDDAGLMLAKWIRETINDHFVRIILRTGQPGRAPEERVIVTYEINDYKEKTELTADKLFSSIVTAIRGYRDIKRINGSKIGMEMILNAAPALFHLQSLKLFASGVLTQLISLLTVTHNAAFLRLSGFTAHNDGSKHFLILAGAGKFEAMVDEAFEDVVSEPPLKIIEKAISTREPVFESDMFAACITGPDEAFSVIYLEGCPAIEEIDLRLINLYCMNVNAAFANNRLYEELDKRLTEKTTLLHEIHHRVKNNLQIILSLFDLTAGEKELTPQAMLMETRKRISAMATIYNQVIYAEDENRIDFAECVNSVINEILRSRPEQSCRIAIDRNIVDFSLTLEKAIPCALLIDELVTLAINTVEIDQTSEKEIPRFRLNMVGNEATGEYCITLENPSVISCIDPESLGMRLVSALVGQLGGTISENNREGTCVTKIVFALRR